MRRRFVACFGATNVFICFRIDINWSVSWEIQAVCVCIVDFTRFLPFVGVLLEFYIRSKYRLSKCAFWHCQIELLANFDGWKQFGDVQDWRDEEEFVPNVNTREFWLLSQRFIGIYRHAIRYRHVIDPDIRAAWGSFENFCYPSHISGTWVPEILKLRRLT
jgi:hypothetical protein